MDQRCQSEKDVRVRGKGWVAILNKVISVDLVKMVASELEMKEMKRLTMQVPGKRLFQAEEIAKSPRHVYYLQKTTTGKCAWSRICEGMGQMKALWGRRKMVRPDDVQTCSPF